MAGEVVKHLDPRSATFVSVQPAVMQAAVDSWPRSERTPQDVARLLDRACRQFLHGDVDYDNVGAAMTTCFVAVELFLKQLLRKQRNERSSIGALAREAQSILTEREHGWLDAVRQLRNTAMHEGDFTVTPGMSDEALTATHQWIYDVSERCMS